MNIYVGYIADVDIKFTRYFYDQINIRETFFMNQLRVDYPIVSSKIADLSINGFDFEIGGRNKSSKQIKTAAHDFVVKDDIETGFLNTIPLWHFGEQTSIGT